MYKGFTLIELLIAFSIISVISAFGIASFNNYANSQKLKSAALDLKTVLQGARSQALHQAKPNNCGAFQGEEVRICCNPNGSNCPNCLSSGNYELDAIFSASNQGILQSSVLLPTGVTVDVSQTTQRTFHFIPITGGVTQGGQITLDGSNNTNQIIKVTGAGVVQ